MRTYVFAGILGVSVVGVVFLLLNSGETDPNEGLTHPSNPPQSVEAPLPEGHPQADPMAQIQALRDRLGKNPDDEGALMELANANMMINRYEEATRLYSRLLDLNPKQLDARNNLAIARLELGNVDEAVHLLEETLEISPDNGPALINLGIIYLQSVDDQQKALNIFERFLKAHPDDPIVPQIRNTIDQIKVGLNHPPIG